MPRRWILVCGLIALNALLLVVGVGRGGNRECAAELCVGLVFDVGGLGDKSFNDAAHKGLLKAREDLHIDFHYVEPGDGTDRESALRQRAAKGDDLVIGVGFIFSDSIRKLAQEFPETKFACVDFSGTQDVEFPKNLLGIQFREHEGAFLVGAIAGQVSKTKAVGFVGGMEIPLIRKFEVGYRAGVKHVCPTCKVFAAYAGTQPKAFADPISGRALALAQYARNADIVFHASGTTGFGVFNAAREVGRWAIGVDADQFHEMPCCVLTSMVKKTDVAVYNTVRELVNGRFEAGIHRFGLAENGVDFVYDDNNRERIPASVVTQVETIRRDIVLGRIEVPSE